MALMLGDMVDGPFTIRSLIETSGLAKTTVYRVVRSFHLKGVIHVGAWEKDAIGRMCIPVYTLGRGKDVKRQIKTQKEINAAFAERKRLRTAARGLTTPLAASPFAGLGA